jgi:hypothetical protein
MEKESKRSELNKSIFSQFVGVLNNDFKISDIKYNVMVKNSKCKLIITNDKKFINKDIELISSEEFCDKYLNN